MHTTASRNKATMVRELRRATSWRSKKFMGGREERLELDLRRLAFLGRLRGLQELRGGEAEHAGEDARREGFAPRVVFHHRVVEGLAREGDLVLRAGELLLQRQHVLVRLE